MRAIADGHIACVDVLLKASADVALSHPECGTALHGAACSGHADIVRLLLQHQASPDTVDTNGDTALMLAALSGHTAVARALVEGGADVGRRHPEYGTAAEIAEQESHADIAALLQGGAAFAPEDAVEVHGLVGAAQHNGKRGVVRAYDAAAGRYVVLLPDAPGGGLKIKAKNLARCEASKDGGTDATAG